MMGAVVVVGIVGVMRLTCRVFVLSAMSKALPEQVMYFIAWCWAWDSGAVEASVSVVVREGGVCGRERTVC